MPVVIFRIVFRFKVPVTICNLLQGAAHSIRLLLKFMDGVFIAGCPVSIFLARVSFKPLQKAPSFRF